MNDLDCVYDGAARFADGSTVTMSGTLRDLANWADNLISMSEGGVTINITRKVCSALQ